MKNSVNRFEALQGLRAIAAGMVVYVHAISTYAEKIAPISADTGSYGLGELGVKLFFCISGFIIYQAAQNLGVGWASVSYFIRRRLIRIAPLYWLATLVYAAKLTLQGSAPEWSEIAKSLLFVPYANEVGLMRPVLGVGWTLNFEMFFYLILAIALFFREVWRVVIIFLPMLLLVLLNHSDFIGSATAAGVSTVLLLSKDYLLFFLAGVCIALINKRFDKIPLRTTFFHAIGVCAVALMLLVVKLSASQLEWVWIVLSELLACAFCVWICANSTNAPLGNKISRLTTLSGDGSFSTYLFHGFVMGVVARVIFLLSLSISPVQFAILMVALCTLIGCVMYLFLEKPMLAFLNATWGRRIHTN